MPVGAVAADPATPAAGRTAQAGATRDHGPSCGRPGIGTAKELRNPIRDTGGRLLALHKSRPLAAHEISGWMTAMENFLQRKAAVGLSP